jgi:hypothetical protein
MCRCCTLQCRVSHAVAQGMSQEKMMLQGTLTNCTPVDFAVAPKVSAEAKVFESTCARTRAHAVAWPGVQLRRLNVTAGHPIPLAAGTHGARVSPHGAVCFMRARVSAHRRCVCLNSSSDVLGDVFQAFIKRCLCHSQVLRPDVLELCNDPYVRSTKAKAAA